MKNWNWKKIWQVIIGIIGMIGAGAGGGAAYNAATAEETASTPTEYASPAPDGDTWTAVVWLTETKTEGGGATPAHEDKDRWGRYTVFVKSVKRPNDKQILDAFEPGLNPEKVAVRIVQLIKPDGGAVPAPDEPEKE